MSVLFVELPIARAAPGQSGAWDQASWPYALFNEAGVLVRQDTARLGLLPKASQVMAVVPPEALAWHRVTLPAAKLNAAKQRAALEGALEDRLLEDPTQLHLALGEAAAGDAGGARWVAATRTEPLRAALAALIASGHTLSRVVPLLQPNTAGRLLALESDPPAHVWLVNAQGVAPIALAEVASLASDGLSLLALPGAAQDLASALEAHGLPDAKVQVVQRHELLAAAQSHLDLAQGPMAEFTQRGGWAGLGAAMRALAFAPRWRALRWGAALLVAVQLLGLNAYAFNERRALAAKRQTAEQILRDTFPNTTVIQDAGLQMQRNVQLLKQSQGALSAGDLEPLLGILGQELKQSSQQVGATTQLNAIEFEANTLLIKVMASQSQASDLKQRLVARGLSVTAGADGNTWRIAPAAQP